MTAQYFCKVLKNWNCFLVFNSIFFSSNLQVKTLNVTPPSYWKWSFYSARTSTTSTIWFRPSLRFEFFYYFFNDFRNRILHRKILRPNGGKSILLIMKNYCKFEDECQEISKILILLKPNYFKKQRSSSSFLLIPKVIQVQNGNGVLNRLFLCLKCIELACWLLQVILDLYYYLR